jgi:HEPN domain-containing protein
MSASPEAPAEAARWKRYAREELALAKALVSDADAPARLACWHSQQAAEKSLKAALIACGMEFPRTHNLVALRALLCDGVGAELDVAELAELTQWGTESRYPGEWAEPSADDARAALASASGVVAAVEEWSSSAS